VGVADLGDLFGSYEHALDLVGLIGNGAICMFAYQGAMSMWSHRLPAPARSAGDPCLDDFKRAVEGDKVSAVSRRNRAKLGL
jgi:hypothetical protein